MTHKEKWVEKWWDDLIPILFRGYHTCHQDDAMRTRELMNRAELLRLKLSDLYDNLLELKKGEKQ